MSLRSLLHISDIHFGPFHLPASTAALSRLIADRSPDVAVIAGDLTQRAKPHQFQAAREWVNGLPCPAVVVPGNHDVPLYRVWERIFSPFGAFRRHFAHQLEGSYQDQELCILGVNSAFNWTTKHGALRYRRVREVSEAFAAAPSGRFRIVVTHHPLILPELFAGERLARGAERAMELFAAAGVDLVLAGHVHQFFLASAGDFCPKLGETPRLLHCGTPTTSRGRGAERRRNSCNWITVGDELVEVQQWVLRGQAFEPARAECWRRDGAGGSRGVVSQPADSERAEQAV